MAPRPGGRTARRRRQGSPAPRPPSSPRARMGGCWSSADSRKYASPRRRLDAPGCARHARRCAGIAFARHACQPRPAARQAEPYLREAALMATPPLLEGKRLLLTGVITRKSIAFAVAEEAQRAGAEVVLTGFGRTRRMTERAAARLPETADVLELDVNDESDLAAVAADLDSRWGSLDGVLHAIAFAPADALGGEFLNTPAESAIEAFRTSAYS